MTPTKVSHKVCLIVIDGWGISKSTKNEGDAISNAKTPVMENLQLDYPTLPLKAHGLHVGLPDNLMGNSEVGHLNLGAGRVVFQDIVRINLAIKNGTIRKSPALVAAFSLAKQKEKLHLVGLVSDGGVHSHIDHLISLLNLAKDEGIKQTFIHFIADGRDTLPKSAGKYLRQLLDSIESIGHGSIATIIGRYYAMDRDKRYERTKIAYDAICFGVGQQSPDAFKAVQEKYDNGETDEFFKPMILNENGLIKDKDPVIFFNFRSDRMRQIVESIGIAPPFESAEKIFPTVFTMTSYNPDFKFPLISPPQSLDNVLAEWLSKHDLPQCHIAETEKYAHVTFFFNGGRETAFAKEERILIPSPKVATYDLQPAMSSHLVADAVVTAMKDQFPLVMCNLAPPDMVGHTGNYEATILAVEATDECIGKVYEACKQLDYILLVTADHGNAEQMMDSNGKPFTAHTTNEGKLHFSQVPFIMANSPYKFQGSLVEPALCDVAPTILNLMGVSTPSEMTGQCLLEQ